MSKADRLDDLFLGEFVHLPFDHGHRLLRPCDGDLHPPLFLSDGVGADNKLPIFHPHLHSGNRSGERGLGDHQRGRGAEDSEDARGAVRLSREDCGDDLHLFLVPLWEQGPDRSVDHARTEDRDIARSSFPLEEPSWDLSARIEPLLVIDTEREIIEVFPACLHTNRNQNTCISIRRQHGSIRLLGQMPRL